VTGPGGAGVHFVTWTDPRAVATWDPDLEPDRFVSGKGHHLLEPYVRLRDRARPVTLGIRPPRGAATLVVSMDDLVAWWGYRRRRAAWEVDRGALRARRVVVVLGDHPRIDRVPGFVGTVIVPNPSGVVDRRTCWLPLPPQRGMVARRPERRGRVRTLALKTGTPNVPDELRDPELAGALDALGVTLRLDERPPTWPDFADVDLVLCTRRMRPEWDADAAFARKPPTKLINAWVAGCIPLVYPEVSHLDLVRPGIDALVVRSPDEVVATVAALQTDPALVARLECGVAARGAEFAMDRVLDRWEALLWADDRPSAPRRAVVGDAVGLLGDAVGFRLRAAAARLRGRPVPGGPDANDGRPGPGAPS
jgi:hypothetical protein